MRTQTHERLPILQQAGDPQNPDWREDLSEQLDDGRLQLHVLPTGALFTQEHTRGLLETLSIGDYGKESNVKAGFLGREEEIAGVPNAACKPLSDKWVITVSTQYGCVMRCTFCDVPKVPMRGNATFDDLQRQFYTAVRLFSDQAPYTDRLNLHFARMGEPIFNPNVFEFARWLYTNKRQLKVDTGLSAEVIHPVLTTSLPKQLKKLEARILEWCEIKNEMFNGQAGLQFSINSTDEEQRSEMFQDQQLPLEELALIADKMPEPIGRKYCLNFAISEGSIVDADRLTELFDPEKFMVKITPIHNNNACRENGIETVGGYSSYTPYRDIEMALREKGWDVLVFVPSEDEEDGLVTCGNVVLGGGQLRVEEDKLNIKGLDPKNLWWSETRSTV